MPSSGNSSADGPRSRIWSTLIRPWWQRIAVRLIFLLLAVSIVPPLTLGILAMRSARVAQEREVWDGNTAIARWGVDKVQSYLANIEEDMRLIVEVGNLHTMDPAAATPLLRFLLSFTEDIKELSLLDALGREQVKVAEGTLITTEDLKSQTDTRTVQIPLGGETYVSPVRTSAFSEPFVSVVVPIRNLAEDKIVGALAAEVNLKRLWDDMLSFKVGKSGYLYLVNEAGQPLAHPDFSLVLARKDLRGANAVRRFLAGEDDPTPRASLEYSNYQGIPVVGLHARIPKLGWAVIVEQPSTEAFANVNRMKVETWLVLVNAVIVTLVVTLLSAQAFTRPLAELAEGARRFGAGEFTHRIPVGSRDEIAEVADGFNAMADRLQESFQHLRILLETSAMTSASLELEQVLTAALNQMDHLAGWPHSGIVLVDTPPAGRSHLVATIRTLDAPPQGKTVDVTPETSPHLWRALTKGKSVSVGDLAALEGVAERTLWATPQLQAVLLVPLQSKGVILGALWIGRTALGTFGEDEVVLAQTMANHVAIAIDNARLYAALRQTSVELESRVEARTRELRDAHEELVRKERLALIGQLAGGVGHELRNPLGGIGNAIYYLRMRLGDGTDPKIHKHLGILDAEVRRANKIVTDLLDFSRVKQPTRAPAQLGAILTDVLERQPKAPTVTIERKLDETLPPVSVDADQVGQVFLNLIMNAIEAMPTGGILTVETEATAEAVVARVIDSGAGVSPENLEKIFQPLFTTKTKGIGLGLAVSRRLTEANGGTLTVASPPGQGAIFTVTFPRMGDPSSAHT